MNADAMATRMSVLTRALPSRILVVDDDELELELIADRLASAGFEVTRASNGEQALALIERQWFPLVITDWQMPVMDGIELTEKLRDRGVADTYVIMLTMRETSMDYERGYVSGVDDYLTKKVPDAELFARIHAAFNTLALRRSLRDAQAAGEQSVTIDADSGAFATSELRTRLLGELRRAQRYGRRLSVVTVGISVIEAQSTTRGVPSAELLRQLVQVMDNTVRSHVDWIGRLESSAGVAFAVVLPEAGSTEAPIVKERLHASLKRFEQSRPGLKLELAFGAASLDRGEEGAAPLEAAQMLEIAELCRACPGRNCPEQLSAVQRSVASHLGIVCRHGYVVDDQCSLKLRTPAAALQRQAG